MKITQFSFKNICSYGNKLQTFKFSEDPQLILVQGKNGSGKSTLCSMLTCEKRSTRGMISICGHGVDHEETKLSIGYCPQNIRVLW